MKHSYLFILISLFITVFSPAQTVYSVSGTIGTSITNAWEQIDITTLGPSQTTIYVDQNVTLFDNVEIPQNITLRFVNGSVITLGDKNLTIYGPIEANAFQIFNCNGRGKTYGLPIVDRVLPQWWKRPEDTIYWDKAIQNAVDFYPKVFFPQLTGAVTLVKGPEPDTVNEVTNYVYGYLVRESIKLDLSKRIPSGYVLSGVGRGSYFSTKDEKNIFGGYVFTCINVPEGGYGSGLIFENLSFLCKNGIAIADCEPATGIPILKTTKFENEKWAISRVEINNCIFRADDDHGGTAVLFIKVFDSEISQNKIYGFKYGVRMLGADLNHIHDNRIEEFYKNAIFERSYTPSTINIGSQNAIIHNDLLTYRGEEGQNAFIKSNANHIEIRDNYLENQVNANRLFAYIDCTMLGMDVDDIYGTHDMDVEVGIGIRPHYSYHIDITGNRCDATTETTDYIYFIDEYLKSLNLVEIPTYGENTASSTFAKIKDNGGTYDGLPLNDNFIDIKLNTGTLIYNKVINMKNCQSFRNWENFSSSNIFTNSSYGDIIIDPKSISYVSRTVFRMPTFNPRSFRLQKSEGAAWPNIEIYLDQAAEGLGDMFENFDIILKVRNIDVDASDAVHSVTDDLYLRIDDVTSTPVLMYQNYAIDIPADDNVLYPSSKNNYKIIVVQLDPKIQFDSSHKYKLTIASRSNSVKEFKEIILHNKVVFVDKDNDTKAKEKPTSQEELLNESEEETIQTLTVKVDNDVRIAPNPVKSNLEISIKKGDVLKKVEIYTETGAFVKDYTDEIENNVIDISNLPNAVYLVKVTSVSNTSKIIIKK